MTTEELTEDVAALKRSVAELESKIHDLEHRPKSNWLPHVLGRFADRPEFLELMEYSEEFRNSGGFPDDATDDEDDRE